MREIFTSGSRRGEWVASIGLALSPTLPALPESTAAEKRKVRVPCSVQQPGYLARRRDE